MAKDDTRLPSDYLGKVVDMILDSRRRFDRERVLQCRVLITATVVADTVESCGGEVSDKSSEGPCPIHGTMHKYHSGGSLKEESLRIIFQDRERIDSTSEHPLDTILPESQPNRWCQAEAGRFREKFLELRELSALELNRVSIGAIGEKVAFLVIVFDALPLIILVDVGYYLAWL